MASVGHIAVGMAAARVYHHGRKPRWSSMALWSGLSLLPDADVIGFSDAFYRVRVVCFLDASVQIVIRRWGRQSSPE
jgi:hypothetical protein